MKNLTYGELLRNLQELEPEQLQLSVMVALNRKVLSVYDTALSCECKGPARELVGDNYPLLIGNKPQE
jgi:hypothetical protein